MSVTSVEGHWITGQRARKVLGITYGGLQRLAVIGKVRVQLEPGCTPRYNLSDVQHLAGQHSEPISAA